MSQFPCCREFDFSNKLFLSFQYSVLESRMFIAGLIVPIFSFSKEGIIQATSAVYATSFIYSLSITGGLLTGIYCLKIFLYCFYLSYYGVLYSTFILPMLTITAILLDQCLDSCFPFSSSSSFSSHGNTNAIIILFFESCNWTVRMIILSQALFSTFKGVSFHWFYLLLRKIFFLFLL